MGTLLFLLEWAGSAVVIFGGFFLLAEFIWWLEHRQLSLRRSKKLINEEVGAAVRKMQTLARDHHSTRPGGWW